MTKWRSEIDLYSRESGVSCPPDIRAAVSLHGHSECSRETLEFIPRIARQIPVVSRYFERSLTDYHNEHGRPLDFGEWYWRPPVTPAAMIESERMQLEQRLDLPGLVSLTDHDTVEGPRTLRANGRSDVLLSVEWSVPYEGCLFHLGVHGISPASIDGMMDGFAAYTAGPPTGSPRRLRELLDALSECPETVIVLNHPCWDLAKVGQLRHDSTLLAFLRAYQDRIDALELNGYRDWAENRLVLPIAKGFALPVVAGGDRHGLFPNTIVNLTRARDWAGFAHELRVERFSRCVVFPEYMDPFVGRIFESAADILRPHHQHHRGQTTWSERVFITMNGHERSVASMWEREPLWLRLTVAITRLIGSRHLKTLFEVTRADGLETLEGDCRLETLFGRVSAPAPDSLAA
ncbi:MAG TPA: hypothetical protein VKE51_12965 [Vicinamibacterales bacterium]|nr:hypothetical protein [Vicinamibacterales bacterium]